MRVFLGSSTEALQDLRRIAKWIEQVGHEPYPWNIASTFPPGEATLARLTAITQTVDAAVLIFSEDDQVWYRGDLGSQPRDNVLIEYGLFLGRLGQPRVIFCVRGKPRIAQDLQGITFCNLSNTDHCRKHFQSWLTNLANNSARLPFVYGHGFNPYESPQQRNVFNDYREHRAVDELWADPFARKHGGHADAYMKADVADDHAAGGAPYLRLRFVNAGYGVNITIRPMREVPVDASTFTQMTVPVRAVHKGRYRLWVRLVDKKDIHWAFGGQVDKYEDIDVDLEPLQWTSISIPLASDKWIRYPHDGRELPEGVVSPDWTVIKLVVLQPCVGTSKKPPASMRHKEQELHVGPIHLQ